MKKNCVKHGVFVCTAILLQSLTFSSCLLSLLPEPNLDSYYDMKIENVTFPDGKITDAYLFNRSKSAAYWYSATWYQRGKGSVMDPVWEAYLTTGTKLDISPLSYYKIEDLGQLSEYAQGNDDFGAYGILEDEKGYYVLSISPPIRYSGIDITKDTARKHKGELAYKVAYITKEPYKPVQPVIIPPTKKKMIDPSSIPDSDRQIIPTKTTDTGAYYYNANLAYQLQWLAVRIACIGTYDMAYTGDFRAKNPTDHYTTRFIKSYLAKSGQTTRGTLLFEGICFDYADFMYQEIRQNWTYLNQLGITRYYMVGTFDDPNDIVAYRIANSGEQSTMRINGTPVIVFSHNRIRAHDNIDHHAWIWAQSKDGTMYWIDPTWTDSSGRPVYGIVRGNKEIRLTPSSDLCVR